MLKSFSLHTSFFGVRAVGGVAASSASETVSAQLGHKSWCNVSSDKKGNRVTRASLLEGKYASWVKLWRELRKRTIDPAQHVSFVLYFLIAVLLFGGAGVWTEMRAYLLFVPTPDQPFPSLGSLRTAVITFFPALAGSSCMQLIWAEDHERSLRAFAFSIIAILVGAIFLLTPAAVSDASALVGGGAASVVALWSWWIANAKQRDLLDLDASTGRSDTSGELPGSLDGFKV